MLKGEILSREILLTKFRKQNIAAWREKQAKLKADREAKAAEAAQNTEEPLEAVVQPAPDAVVEEVAEAVDVVEEPVEIASEPVAEPETPIERPDREFDSFVEDNVGKYNRISFLG